MGLTFANKITVCRILAVPFFISAVLYYSPHREYFRYWALGIFLFAVISDFIDGYVARNWHQKTKAGTILDPLADKLLLISAFITLYKMREVFGSVHFPMWLVVAAISREIILILGATIIQIQRGDLELNPTVWGKATTFFQMTCILGILVQWKNSLMIWDITFALTIISGIDYIREGIKILNNGAKS